MMPPLRVLIVDDERLARERLRQLLAEIPGAVVVGEASRAVEATRMAAHLQPDVLLLDIRMPGIDGLSLAKQVPELPAIIFTTAYEEHAVEAFELAAVDYLLKPIKQSRLQAALERVRGAGAGDLLDRMRSVLAALGPGHETPVRITAKDGDAYHVFDPTRISRFTAADKYVVFQFEGREVVLEDSLTRLEQRLASLGFFRVNRGELINLGHVQRLTLAQRAGHVELSDGQVVRVSRRAIPELKRRLDI